MLLRTYLTGGGRNQTSPASEDILNKVVRRIEATKSYAQSWISIGDLRTPSVKLRSEATRCVPLTRITRRLTAVSLKSAVLLTEERCH